MAWSRCGASPEDDNPLFNQPATLTADVLLGADALGFSCGTLTLEGLAHAVELRVGLGEEPRLDVVGHFDVLTAAESASLGALLPQVSTNPSFGLHSLSSCAQQPSH